ncbi:MAG: hypothetical protein OET44_07645 [Gammaproteobacteria bacterium]|nr:hypothetical protein [Gammaproteobacteria bacterium]
MIQEYPDFLSQDRPQTLIVYGIVTNPETIANGFGQRPGERPAELTNRYALVSPVSLGLRLSSPGWIDISFQQMSQVKSTGDIFDLCRERIINRSSPFSKLIRLFLERYLEFARAQLEVHKHELGAGPSDNEIFDYRDWVFSAWLPLPQAQILLPPAFDARQPSFAELDIAFSLSAQLIGVKIDGASTPIKSRQKKLNYLIEHHPHLTVVHVPKNRLRDETFIQDLFPESIARFWQGLSLPQGPCPPEILLNRLAP